MSPPELTKSGVASSAQIASPHRSNREAAVKLVSLASLGQLGTGGWHDELEKRSFWSPFVLRVSVILASWLAAGAIQAPAQEGLSHAEDPALLGGSTGSIRTNFFWASTHSGRSSRTAATSSPHPSPKPKATEREANRMRQGGSRSVPGRSPSARERDGFRQPTDVAGIVVPEDDFLTRPLWGVGDTGPWLHDGRAESLEEAILLHRSEGSEANDVIDAFTKLPRGDRDAIIKFLLTLGCRSTRAMTSMTTARAPRLAPYCPPRRARVSIGPSNLDHGRAGAH